MATIHSKFALDQIRMAGRMAAEIVESLSHQLEPGVSADWIDQEARRLCRERGVEPAFLGYQGFPGAICLSVNDEVVHGIPAAQKILAVGDLVKLDFGVKYNGYYSDHCRTFAVGQVSPIHQKLLTIGQAATNNAVKLVRPDNRIGDLSWAMQSTAEEAGFSVVRLYIGHGIGKHLHEDPEIPAFGRPGTGPTLHPDMVICVECQVCEKGYAITHDRDGWTSRTKDGGYVVMFEHMVHITAGDPEILTKLD